MSYSSSETLSSFFPLSAFRTTLLPEHSLSLHPLLQPWLHRHLSHHARVMSSHHPPRLTSVSLYQPRFQPTREWLLLICYPIRTFRPWMVLMRHPFLSAARMVLAADSRIPMQDPTGTRMCLSVFLTHFTCQGNTSGVQVAPHSSCGSWRTAHELLPQHPAGRNRHPPMAAREKRPPVCRELPGRAGIARTFKRSQSALQGTPSH